MKIIQENKNNVGEIITALKNGAVLVSPTDTVYGLVCDAENEKALEQIFLIKKRDKSKPLLVFVSSIEEAKKIAEISAQQENFLKNKWPGKTTAILKSKKGGTVGIRIPDYEFLRTILKEFGKPLAQTSANISGGPSPTEIKEFFKQFEGQEFQPDLIIDAGDLPKNEPSIIMDLTGREIKILRK